MTRQPVTRHTDALEQDAGVAARVGAALRDGRDTAQARAPRANPWRHDSPSAVDRALAAAWARGYRAGNPVVLDD